MNIASWLSTREREQAGYGFKVVDIVEVRDVDDSVVEYLSRQMVLHHGAPQLIRDECRLLYEDAKELGLHDLACAIDSNRSGMLKSVLTNYLAESVLPDANSPFNPRVGNWGEIVSAMLLVDLEGFWLPIFKLRYREKRNFAMRLTDLCVLRRDEPPLVCLGEVKTHSSTHRDNDLAVDGLKSLIKGDVFDQPEILHFVANRLYEQGAHEEGQFVSRIRLGKVKVTRRYDIYLVHERDCWDEEILRRLNDQPLDKRLVNFSVRVLAIRDLRGVIDRSYESCWRVIPELLDG